MIIYNFLPENRDGWFASKSEKDSIIITEKLSHGRYSNFEEQIDIIKQGKTQNFDIPWLYPDGLLCNDKAYKKLKIFLKQCGNWNRLYCDEEAYYYFSVTKCLDALDEEKTQFDIEDNIILDIDKYVFSDNVDYTNYPIFRLSCLPVDHPYVTQDFVNFVASNNLTGLKFRKVVNQ